MAGEDYIFRAGFDKSAVETGFDQMEIDAKAMAAELEKANQRVKDSFNQSTKGVIAAISAVKDFRNELATGSTGAIEKYEAVLKSLQTTIDAVKQKLAATTDTKQTESLTRQVLLLEGSMKSLSDTFGKVKPPDFKPVLGTIQQLQSKIDELNKKKLLSTTQTDIANYNKSISSLKDQLSKLDNLGLDPVKKKQDQLSGSSGKAQIALMNLSRVAQDAPYGFIGIANNLDPLLESFQALRKSTGSVGGALGALGQSLSGAGGIGLALSVATSLIVAFGDQLVDFFEKLNIGTGDVEKALEKQTAYNVALKEANDVMVELVESYSKLYVDRSSAAEQAVSLAQAQGKSESEVFALRQKATEAKRLENVSILANLGLTEKDVVYNETLLQYKQEQLQAILSNVTAEKELSDYDKKRADLLKAQIDSIKSTTEKGRAAVDDIRGANDDIANGIAANNLRIYQDGLKSATALAEARVVMARKNTEEELQARIAAIRAQQREELTGVNLTAGERTKITVEANKAVDKLNRDFATLQVQNQISLQKAIESTARQGSAEYYSARRQEIQLATDIELKAEGVTAEKIKEIQTRLAKELLVIDREQIIKAAQERIGTNVNNINAQISNLSGQSDQGNRNDQIVALQQQLVTEQAELEKVSVRNSELSALEKQSKINAIDAKAFADRKKLFDDFTKTSIKADADYYNSRIELENAALQIIADDESKSERDRFNARQKLLDNDTLILQGQLTDQEELYKKGIISFREYQTQTNAIQGEIGANNAQKDKNAKDNSGDIFSALGINGNKVKEYAAAASEAGKVTADFLGMIADGYQRKIDTQQASIDADDKMIDSLQAQVDKEKDLLDRGRANNYDALQQRLKDAKEQRAADQKNLEETQKKQDQIRKAQIIADGVSQVSSLVTASAELFKVQSKLGLPGVILAVASIGLMLGAFVTARASATKAVGEPKKFRHGGMIDGPSHEHGGRKYRALDGSNDVVELEGGEHVTNKESTRKARPLLDAINNMSIWDMNDAALGRMMENMGITSTFGRVKEVVKVIHTRDRYQHQAALKEAQQPDYTDDIRSIKETNQYLAKREKERPIVTEDAKNWHFHEDGHLTRSAPKDRIIRSLPDGVKDAGIKKSTDEKSST